MLSYTPYDIQVRLFPEGITPIIPPAYHKVYNETEVSVCIIIQLSTFIKRKIYK